MLDKLLWVSAVIWAWHLLQFILNRAVIRPLPKTRPPAPEGAPLVSIVSPARNEARGIRKAVASFCGQDYPHLEVLVVEDCSSDATPEILEELRSELPRLQIVPGKEPPRGWLGKPNALELGRRAAKGEWIVFSDADVAYAPDLISRAVAFARGKDAAMLSLWPEFIAGEPLETVICSKFALGFAIAPVWLVPFRSLKFAAMGTGVFNMLRRDALEACGAFESLRDAVVDDIELGYKIKAAGFGQRVALAGDLLRIRMYYGFRETMEGFTKNSYPLLRKIPLLLFAFVPLGLIVMILPYVGAAWGLAHGTLNPPALTALALMHATAGACVALFRLPWYVAFLSPVSEILWWWIVLKSFFRCHLTGIVWRGRVFKAAD